MIWESHAWKVDLAKRAEWLSAKKLQRRWPEAASVRVEQCVMIGCYCIRKLLEANKLTDVVSSRQLPVLEYEATGKPVHTGNWHKLDELYRLDHGRERTVTLRFLCNQLIHSFVYVNVIGEDGGLDGFMFCSERERQSALFHMSLDALIETFHAVAQDHVTRSCSTWNAGKRDFDVMQR